MTFLNLRDVHLVGFLSFLLCISSCYGQSSRIQLESCATKAPISDAYVLDEFTGKFLGYTNHLGFIELPNGALTYPLSLHIYKMSSLDTSVVLNRGITTVCLNEKKHKLATFEVQSSVPDLGEVFEQYIDKSVSALSDVDTTHYFSFQYECTVPDSNWTLKASGTIEVPCKSYAKANSGGYGGKFCELEIWIDSAFYHADFFNETNFNDITPLFTNYDMLRKRSPYRKNEEKQMVLKRIDMNDSIMFTISRPIKNRKLMISYPLFNQDSLLVQDEIELKKIHNNKNSKATNSLEEEHILMGYELFKEHLILSSIDVNNSLVHQSGLNFNIKIQAKLIAGLTVAMDDLSIFLPFTKSRLEKIPQSEGFKLHVE